MLDLLDVACVATALVAGATGCFLLLGTRSAMSSRSLAVVMLAAATWALLSIVLPRLPSPSAMADLTRLIVAAAAVQATAGAWFCLSLAGRRPARRRVPLLAVHPVLLAVALLTDRWTHLVVRRVDVGPDGLAVTFGPAFWAHTVYSYALLGAGLLALLGAATRSVAGHRLHYLLAVVAVLPPVLGNVVSVSGAAGGQRDLTAPLFVVTAMLWFWVDRVSTRFRAAPITTQQVLQAVPDGVVVVDASGRLVDVNPAAARLLGVAPERGRDLLGRHWRDVADGELVVAVDRPGARSVLRADGSVLDVRVTAVTGAADAAGDGRPMGWVVVARDVTEVERLRAELAEQALRDGLTGLPNRRRLEQAMAEALTRAAPGPGDTRPVALAVVDLDRFKSVNDEHGHLVGDDVLRALGRLLAATAAEVGPDALAARLGGEEFVLLLPGLDEVEAVSVVDRLRGRCAGLRVPVPGGTLQVTLSAGVAGHRAGQDGAGLLGAADAALYAAKAAGRDRVVLAGPPPLLSPRAPAGSPARPSRR